jgi:hypothetical protein
MMSAFHGLYATDGEDADADVVLRVDMVALASI